MLTTQRLEVLEDALHTPDTLFGTFDLYRIRAKIDPHAEQVLHQSQGFIAGPEGGPIGIVSGSNNQWFSEPAPQNTDPAPALGTIADPLFISVKDFHLRAGSPAKGTGVPVGGLATDLDAAPRPISPAIGAYE